MDEFAERRRKVLQQLDGVMVLPSAPVVIRNNDVEHDYRQDSDLFYLTGFDEPDCCLVLSSVHDEHQAVMFVRPRDPKREIWDGARAGVEGALKNLAVDAAFPIGELGKRLGDYLAGAAQLYYSLGHSSAMDGRMLAAIRQARGKGRAIKPWPTAIRHLEPLLHEQRLFKDDTEVEIMRQAAAISDEAHRAAMAAAKPGMHEYEIEALLRQAFGRHGCPRAAYAPIVGSGPNACTLHYISNRRKMEDGDLLLIDAGCEHRYYASDVTRTFPVNGTFSAPQRAIYEVVLEAQLAAIAEAFPGSNIDAVHEVGRRKLVEGMLRIGLLAGDADQIIKDGAYKRVFMHRSSHWLGMDVHDVGAYYVDGECRPLEAGMVITVEPGIYVAPHDEESPAEFRGIGIRLEDDILITADGQENLTAAIPKTIEEVETACSA